MFCKRFGQWLETPIACRGFKDLFLFFKETLPVLWNCTALSYIFYESFFSQVGWKDEGKHVAIVFVTFVDLTLHENAVNVVQSTWLASDQGSRFHLGEVEHRAYLKWYFWVRDCRQVLCKQIFIWCDGWVPRYNGCCDWLVKTARNFHAFCLDWAHCVHWAVFKIYE